MSDAHEVNPHKSIGKFQTVASILWPSFIVAGIANSIFWVFVDPYDFGLITGCPELSPIGAYSLGFIALWATLATSSFLTQLFSKPSQQVNKKST